MNALARKIMNNLVDEKGDCQMKPLVDKWPDYVDPNQLELF